MRASLLSLALTTACYPELKPVPQEPAPVQLTEDTAQTESVVNAGGDGQELGCVAITNDVSTEISYILAMQEGAPEGDFSDRRIGLYADDGSDAQEISPEVDAGPNGDLRFDLTAAPFTLVAGNYDLCLNGNPGATPGTYNYMIESPDSVVASEGLGGAYPVRFSPFTVE